MSNAPLRPKETTSGKFLHYWRSVRTWLCHVECTCGKRALICGRTVTWQTCDYWSWIDWWMRWWSQVLVTVHRSQLITPLLWVVISYMWQCIYCTPIIKAPYARRLCTQVVIFFSLDVTRVQQRDKRASNNKISHTKVKQNINMNLKLTEKQTIRQRLRFRELHRE